MIVRIDPASSSPPADQLFAQVVAHIEVGSLAAGSSLPTIRSLAGDLGVSPGTVARAYADLERNGWIVTQGRRGTAVAPRPPARGREVQSAALVFVEIALASGVSEAEAHRAIDVAFARCAGDARGNGGASRR